MKLGARHLLPFGSFAFLVSGFPGVATAQTPPDFVLEWGATGAGPGDFLRHHGIVVAADGSVYVADTNNNRIQKFTANGTFLFEWGSLGTAPGEFDAPHGIALSPSGDVYVAEHGATPRIQRFTPDGVYLGEWGSFGVGPGEFQHPHGIAIDASGDVYVACNWQLRVQKFSADGTFLFTWGTPGLGDGEFQGPNGVAVDANGDVFVADSSHRIQKFTSAGHFLLSWGSEGTGDGQFLFPRGIATDSAGNLLVVDRDNHRLQMFDGSGTFLTKWGSLGGLPGELNRPYAVAVGVDDAYVYVNDSSNDRVQKFCFSGAVATCDDCNENGVPDGKDVAAGTSTDFDGNGVPDECDPLSVDVDQLPLVPGATQTFTLNAGTGLAGGAYLLVGSASGTSPGFVVGSVVLPLNVDFYFLVTLASPSFLQGSAGVLDGDGQASASLTLPGGLSPTLVGITLHHAYGVLNPGPAFASNAVPLTLAP